MFYKSCCSYICWFEHSVTIVSTVISSWSNDCQGKNKQKTNNYKHKLWMGRNTYLKNCYWPRRLKTDKKVIYNWTLTVKTNVTVIPSESEQTNWWWGFSLQIRALKMEMNTQGYVKPPFAMSSTPYGQSWFSKPQLHDYALRLIPFLPAPSH